MERFYFNLQCFNDRSSLLKVRAETHGSTLNTGAGAEAMEKHCFLFFPHPLHCLLS